MCQYEIRSLLRPEIRHPHITRHYASNGPKQNPSELNILLYHYTVPCIISSVHESNCKRAYRSSPYRPSESCSSMSSNNLKRHKIQTISSHTKLELGTELRGSVGFTNNNPVPVRSRTPKKKKTDWDRGCTKLNEAERGCTSFSTARVDINRQLISTLNSCLIMRGNPWLQY